jgi:tetratricopeptide (TPR) repeat protein
MSDQLINPPSYDFSGQPERRLWESILLSMVHDLCAPHKNFSARQNAERWIGSYPSADFRQVVSLAGLDPQATWDRLSAMAALPFEDRTWVRDNATQVKNERRKTLHLLLRTVQKSLGSGNIDSAIQAAQSLLTTAPYDPRVLALNAQCMAVVGDHLAAIQIYDRLLTQQDSGVIWAAKARSLMALGHYRRASRAFARATTLAQSTRFIAEQATCTLAAGKLNDALDLLEVGRPPSKTDRPYQLIRAKILTQMGCMRDAFGHASQAAKWDQTGQAISLARQNSPDKAAFSALCDQTALHTVSPKVLAEISWDHPDCIAKKSVDTLIQVIGDPSHEDVDKAQAHLVMFRKYDHIDDRLQALGHLRKYHSLSPKYTCLQQSQDSALFTTLIQLKIPRLQLSKTRVLPIFVTGLPGSGCHDAKTVLVQAAACGGARPLLLVPAVMTRFLRQLRESKRTEITRADLFELQAELREGLEQAANGCDVIVDTTALNFKWSGLITAALPEARIVHLKRNHMATGWALHNGSIGGAEFGCRHDLLHIRNFQHRSAALMAHWERDFTPSVMSVSGDALLLPSGAAAQAMVEACQLKWSNQCDLVSRSPDQSWHRYAAYLNPLK